MGIVKGHLVVTMVDLIIGAGGERDPESIKLETKKRRWINNVQSMERPPGIMRAAEEVCRSVGSDVQTRSLSSTYNCYGMVFASRRTCIIDEEEIPPILNDDGYYLVLERTEVRCGDIIVYRKGQGAPIAHVGLIIGIDHDVTTGERKFTVLSQWGRDGEYVHPERAVPPAFGDHIQYFSERRKV